MKNFEDHDTQEHIETINICSGRRLLLDIIATVFQFDVQKSATSTPGAARTHNFLTMVLSSPAVERTSPLFHSFSCILAIHFQA